MRDLRKAILTPKARVDQNTIRIYNMVKLCERYGTLPHAGGLLDQDFLFVKIMENIVVWEDQRAELDRSRTESTSKI